MARLQIECMDEVRRDLSLWTPAEPGGIPKLPQDIIDLLCTNNCNDHGKCISGAHSIIIIII